MNRLTIRTPKTVTGVDAFELKAGTIVKVIGHKDASNLGDILMKTDQNSKPFVSIELGQLWGNALENYVFEVIEGEVKIQIE